MNRLPSSAFRKSFPRITEMTVVTVHGHPIGTWHPIGGGPDAIEAQVRHPELAKRTEPRPGARAFNSRPFRPVPKSRG
jgi:hypothetical protein